MRKNIIVANWKMNLDREEAFYLVNNVIKSTENMLLHESENSRINVPLIVFAPSYLYLDNIANLCSEISLMSVASQDCSANIKGAFTGEVSASMLYSCNVEYVILGHSERRTYFNESSLILRKKIGQALDNNLKIIFCCGESLEEREKGNHFSAISSQIKESLFHLNSNEFENVVIAYEPIWAIGTGTSATNEQAQQMHSYIRNVLKEKYTKNLADNTSIIYGGSCNTETARGLFQQVDIDGALVGGASLNASDFVSIIKSFECNLKN